MLSEYHWGPPLVALTFSVTFEYSYRFQSNQSLLTSSSLEQLGKVISPVWVFLGPTVMKIKEKSKYGLHQKESIHNASKPND